MGYGLDMPGGYRIKSSLGEKRRGLGSACPRVSAARLVRVGRRDFQPTTAG